MSRPAQLIAPRPGGRVEPAARARRRRLRADLRAIVRDGVAFSVMVGVGESYIPAFALALGHGSITAGLVATLPMLAGAVLQLVTPAAVGLLGSHRRWVVLCAGLQAASFVPLITGALGGELALSVLYLAVALYWGFGMSTGPAWTAWVTTLVPERIRAPFFARRARSSQLALVAALVVGGVVLELGEARGATLLAYAVVFAAAAVARGVSAAYLARQSEPSPAPIGETRISPTVIRRHMRTGGHGRLLVYLLLFQLGVWIAAPFFTPYMLGPLGLPYLEFMLITTAAFASRVVALPALGRLVQHTGTKQVLWWASLGIVPVPALWIVSDSFAWLLVLQLFSGIVWAAFELASLLSFFERIPLHGRTSILTVYNLAQATAIVVGSAIGALVLHALPSGRVGFFVVLVLSTTARLVALPLLRSVEDTPEPGAPPTLRTLSVRPSSGGVQRPVLTDPECAPG